MAELAVCTIKTAHGLAEAVGFGVVYDPQIFLKFMKLLMHSETHEVSCVLICDSCAYQNKCVTSKDSR